MRVLVLNDKRSERDAIVVALQRASCRVEAVADARAAAAALARDPYQVVLIAWPNGGGFELVKTLQVASIAPHPYTIALLEPAVGGRDIPLVLASGVNDFMRRPLIEEELVARVQAPARLIPWTRSLATPDVFDLGAPSDLNRLRAWQTLGSVVAEDLGQLVGQSLFAVDGYPPEFGSAIRAATIPMTLASEKTELRVSIAADAKTIAWLGAALLNDPAPSNEDIDDVLRELANTAGGALKRAALPESVTLTTGMPVNGDRVPSGDAVRSFTAMSDSEARIAIVGEVRRNENQHLPATRLREGMILVNDLRSETGALLVAAGSRLTTTTADRVAKMLGERFMVEIAPLS